jgi:hypothetical protein
VNRLISKLIIFCFSFLGIFALLFVAVPAAFYENQEAWVPSYFRTDQQVTKFFNAHNITVYNSQYTASLIYPSHNEIDGGLGAGKKLDIYWDLVNIGNVLTVEALGINYLTQHWFLGVFEYWTQEGLHFTALKNGNSRGDWIIKNYLETDFESRKNGTAYFARCNSGVTASILYTGNETGTIGNSWDAGKLAFMLSYEFNATSSSVNMFTLLGQILTFQAPSLGVPGLMGDLLNAIIAIPIYAMSGFIIYKLITGIAPWLSGGSGD